MSQRSERTILPLAKTMGMVGSYARSRLAAQLRSAVPIVLYLLAVQVLLLGASVQEAGRVAVGVGMVVIGLAAFLEGLMLAVMPVGELCGVGLPRRVGHAGILGVAFVLGLLATAAEPAIIVLQRIGASVEPWDAPLLFVLLGRHALWLVLTIGVGVGLAVAIGMLRSLLGWSLKPFLAVSVAVLLGITFWARMEPNLALILGLAWDAGAVTTGPVTVPLVLALGAGLSRMTAREGDEGSGFGSIALASLIPVLTVLALGALLLPSVPRPMSPEEFLAADRTTMVRQVFGDQRTFDAWAVNHLSEAERAKGGAEEPVDTQGQALGEAQGAEAHFEAQGAVEMDSTRADTVWPVLLRSARQALQAVVPLALMLLAILRLLLRQRLPWRDETILGAVFCLGGMALFTAGLEIGLLRLGEQSGESLPSLFLPAERVEKAMVLESFDQSVIFDSVSPDGRREQFFYLTGPTGPTQVPFVAERYDPEAHTYLHVPSVPPRFPGAGGLIALLAVALGLGFTVTLVEPALAALGVTLENVTVGVFPRQRLITIVAAGVGVGTIAGFAMLIWDIPLLWLLAPLYAVLLALTAVSSELFAAIAWDSGGVTTGPMTVPLVLAVGSGLGGRLGSPESFGILALESGFSILGVLLAGLSVNRGRSLPSRGPR